MTEVSIIASKSRATFNVPFQIGENVFSMKFDTGAASTVISSEIFIDEMTEEKKSTIKNFLQERNVIGIEFTSASGDCFVGYLIHANGVVVDEAVFADFYYYLVLDNKRVIALLGDDFIDHCECQHPCKYSLGQVLSFFHHSSSFFDVLIMVPGSSSLFLSGTSI